MHYTFVHNLDPIVVEDPLVVLCLADRTLVEVKWHVQRLPCTLTHNHKPKNRVELPSILEHHH
jgi:hypothetical protein